MNRNLFLGLLMILSTSDVNAMSEFDTLGRIIASGFYSGNPVSCKFVVDWADSAPKRFVEQINAQYFVKNEVDQDDLVEAMMKVLESKITAPNRTKFEVIMNDLRAEEKRRAVPFIFNYMQAE